MHCHEIILESLMKMGMIRTCIIEGGCEVPTSEKKNGHLSFHEYPTKYGK